MKDWTFSRTVEHEFIASVCGELLGAGMSRRVFSFQLDKRWVIKVEDTTSCKFQNVVEWQTWLEVKDNPAYAKYFAPCEWISQSGSVLIMARTRSAAMSELPKQMPAFMCDFKHQNYGMLDGQVVCHDYGTNLARNHGIFSKGGPKMRKANWYDEEIPT